MSSDVDQLTVSGSGPSLLTGADRANGITEKWCVNVYHVTRPSARWSTNPQWEDRRPTILVVRDQNVLKASRSPGIRFEMVPTNKAQHSILPPAENGMGCLEFKGRARWLPSNMRCTRRPRSIVSGRW
jgi:hypothetical protein